MQIPNLVERLTRKAREISQAAQKEIRTAPDFADFRGPFAEILERELIERFEETFQISCGVLCQECLDRVPVVCEHGTWSHVFVIEGLRPCRAAKLRDRYARGMN